MYTTATKNPPSAASKQPLPAPSTPLEHVLAMLQAGRLSLAEYKAWDASRNLQREDRRRPQRASCRLSRQRFFAHAGALAIDVGTEVINGKPRAFKPDDAGRASFGWNITGKFAAIIDGVEVTVQLSGNAIVVGSKEAPAA